MTELAADARDRVGPYRVLRAIGAGGSARVDLARIDRAYNFQRHVVIKRPLEHLRADEAVAESLRREARIGGKLRHPNMVAVLDAGMHDGYDYLALEYVHGTSLRSLMQTETAGLVREIPLDVALGIVVDVCRALHAAHELTDEHGAPLGLVHRDVSPGNVLLGLDGAVKLADFGIAKETRVATLSGSMHGTVTYMAPEQCRGQAFDRRADIFSIGVILYELVTRRRLFWADNDVASLHRVLSGQVAPPRTIDPAISPALERIVMRATAHLADHRFGTTRELADAIEALAAAEGHVLGARWLARTLEEEVGPKHAPWIAATTIVQPIILPESSLVDLIAATPDPDEELVPTFGPLDERSIEEGSVPSLPTGPVAPPIRVASTAPARARSRGLWWVVAGSALAGVAVAVVASTTRHHAAPAAAVVPAVAEPATGSPVSSPPAPQSQVAPPQVAPPQVAATPSPRVAPSGKPAAGLGGRVHHKTGHAHQTSALLAGSDSAPPVTASTPPAATASPAAPSPAAGSANHAAWDPNLLLPSDKKPKP
ncbi:MAG TPA: serine/threonine-protein kinase [Kofleriaceae bacterium]